MEEVHIIGIDLAKQNIQLHDAREDKEVKTPWDYAKANAALKRKKSYWRLSDALFQ